MTDIVTFRLSARANDVAAKLIDAKKLDGTLSADKFALAYTIKKHFDTFDPKSYSVSDSAGNTIMSDHLMHKLFRLSMLYISWD